MPPKRKRPKATQAQLNAIARKYKLFHIEVVTDEKRSYKRRKPKTPAASSNSNSNLSTSAVENADSTSLVSAEAPVSSSALSSNQSKSASFTINNSSLTPATSSTLNTSALHLDSSISSSSGTNEVSAAIKDDQFITPQSDSEHGILESYGDMNGDDKLHYDDVVDSDKFPPDNEPATVRSYYSDRRHSE
ncbi:hypothetical protein BKA69DRAFT_1129722 [Paraphysoderma sedebokerense]|nr:hypothetical protein BKA69DRAFT_1129722 [Paraphysoderma sedebokerense]